MYRDLFAHLDQSPFLVLPVVALFLFLGVFLAVSIRAATRGRAEMSLAAALPLDGEDGHE